mmetsp:Transcript_2126/g.3238  ORF Transcript_2126/g.3238 Transcript_2126/m.3238 type:complete len:132 (-) Transcript_2126:1047-1442(-)
MTLDDIAPRPAPVALIFPLLSLWAFVGTLIRVFLADLLTRLWVDTGPGSVLYSVILANLFGSWLFGVIVSIEKAKGPKLFPPILFTSLTSWLCGSITSFSTWNAWCLNQIVSGRHGFLLLAQASRPHTALS